MKQSINYWSFGVSKQDEKAKKGLKVIWDEFNK